MHRRVIYQALAWVPIAAGAATGAVTMTTHQVINKTVVYEESTTYAQPPAAVAETITVDKWYRPLDIPTRRLKSPLYGQQNFGYSNFTPVVAETITVDKWYAQLTTPTRRQRPNPDPQELAQTPFTPFVATPGDATLGFGVVAPQIVNKTIIYEESAYAPFTPVVAETITADKWWQQYPYPVRRRFIVAEEGSYFASPPAPQANDLAAWYRPLDWPTRLKRITAEEGSLFAPPGQPEARDQVAWRRDLDLPTRLKRLPVTAGLSFVTAAPGGGTAYNWFQSLDEPLRIRRPLRTELSYGNFTPAAAEEITVDKWWRELDRPTRRKLIVEGAYSAAPPRPGANDTIGWHKPLSEPFRLKKTPTSQLSLTFIAAAPGAGVAYNWFGPLDEPLRIRRTPKTVLNWSSFTPAPTEVVTIDKWWQELVRPTRRIKPVPQQQGYTFVAAAPGAGAAYNWFQALDVPTRRDRRRIADQQFRSYGNFTPPTIFYAATSTSAQVFRRSFIFDPTAIPPVAAAGAGTAYNWFQQLDTPTRARKLRELPYSAIPVYFVPAIAGPGNEYNWWQPLDEPIRPRRSIRTAQQWPVTVPSRLLTTTLENGWWQQLDLPTRRKQTFGQYPGTAQGNFNPVVPNGWQQLQTPYRLKARVNYDVAQAPYLQIELITADKWWRELVRPIYTKRVDRPALTQGNINPVVPYAHLQLYAPLRLKGRIDYPALIRPSFPFAFPGTGLGTAQPWPALSEPVRFSPRLRPSQQQFLSHPALLISSDLDPACRVIDVFDGRVISSSGADDVVVASGQSDLTPAGPDDDLTPVPGNIVKVKC